MNCKQVQELLPLYAGRDLEEKHEAMVAVHLQSCAECLRGANEYRETQELLHELTAPAFSEGIYAGIRQRVLRQIEADSGAPSLFKLSVGRFRPRLTWAIASALLIAVSLFAFYFISIRRSVQPDFAGKDPTTVHPNVNHQSEPGSRGEDNASHPPRTNKAGIKPRLAGVSKSQRGKSRPVIADRRTSGVANTPDASATGANVSPATNVIEPTLLTAPASAASEKTLRVEIQTRDPNIRIIWFTPQETKPAVPNSKGT